MKDKILEILNNHKEDIEACDGMDYEAIFVSDFSDVADDIMKLIIRSIFEDAKKDLDFRKEMIDMVMKGAIAYEIKDGKIEYTNPLDPKIEKIYYSGRHQ